jgi:probable F420-dependent oxidoreductase
MATEEARQRLRRRMGRAGIWMPPAQRFGLDAAATAAAIERAGFGSVWVGGGHAEPDAFRRLEPWLAATERLIIATGIANIWARSPSEMFGGAAGLEDQSPGRFVLGLGVSHAPLVARLGQTYERPMEAMRKYLDELEHPASHAGYPEAEAPPLVLAALGPRMLRLARDHTDGAHPYFTTPEHTASARSVLGSSPLLIPEQAVVLSSDRAEALAAGRAYTTRYLQMPNYVSSLARLGFGPGEVAGGGSDRLVEAIVPYGPEQAAARVREHLQAGADHVVIQPLGDDGKFSVGQLDALAQVVAEFRDPA